jgi:hypothetical protein
MSLVSGQASGVIRQTTGRKLGRRSGRKQPSIAIGD